MVRYVSTVQMILDTVYDGPVTKHTPLGNIDLSGYSVYSVLLRIDEAKSDTEDFRFTTYHNNIQVYQHDFKTTGGWHIHNVVHNIFHPKISFVLYNWKNEAKVKLWIYATCCNHDEIQGIPKIIRPKSIEFTEFGIIK